jgi:hypothetical protein
MPVRIRNGQDFERLTSRLGEDLIKSHTSYHLHKGLLRGLNDDRRIHSGCSIYAQSLTSWNQIISSSFESAFGSLCRLYDQHRGALSLKTWLETIQQNPTLFNNNPLNPGILIGDLQKVSRGDPQVVCLVKNRNKAHAHAHIDPDLVLQGFRVGGRFPLSYQDIEDLLTRAKELLNRYGNLFNANSFSCLTSGCDDYQFILESIRGALDRRP